MSVHLITPPTQEVVTLDEAKQQLRKQNTTEYDDLIRALIKAAVDGIDPSGGGWLGRALRPQTWELRAPSFPYDACRWDGNVIYLPFPPLISLDSVTYVNGDGDDVVMVDSTDYRVLGGGRGRSYVAPIYGGTWPVSVRYDAESVRVRFTSGYSSASPPDRLPTPIKQAVLLAVRDLWSLGERNLYLRSESAPGLASYEWTVSEMAGKAIREATENLLRPYRVFE